MPRPQNVRGYKSPTHAHAHAHARANGRADGRERQLIYGRNKTLMQCGFRCFVDLTLFFLFMTEHSLTYFKATGARVVKDSRTGEEAPRVRILPRAVTICSPVSLSLILFDQLHLRLHLSLTRGCRWGTKRDFITSFLHLLLCSPLPSGTCRTLGLSIP